MNLLKIDGGIENKPIKIKKPEPPKTSPDMIKLHCLSAFIGHRNSGKTNSAVLLAHRLKKENAIQRIFVISPTYASNPIFSILNIDDDDVYDDLDTVFEALIDIENKMKEDRIYYNNAIESRQLIEKLINKGEHTLSLRELMLLDRLDYKPLSLKYGGHKPSFLLIVDDCSHSKLYSNTGKNKFTNLCLRHRHLSRMGISIFMLVQNFKGLPKCLRQNMTQCLLWKTHDNTQLDAIYEELLGNQMSKEQFYNLYNKGIEGDDHNFLMVDLDPKDKNKKYRKNFDNYIML